MKKCLLVISIVLTGLVYGQSNYRMLINGSLEDVVMNPVYSPDGSKIAYTQSGYKGISVYDLSSKGSTKLTDEDAAGFGFIWSSDSKSILTRVAKYEDMRRYNAVKIFDVTTGESKQLSDYKTMMPYLPVWADGDSKVYLPVKGNDEVL
ncbi:MAG: hypothetical protein Q8M94_16265, partial [Ignavibacteria bacterium]|nr:hypothetical protein [Ignavibacteria bacterium]